MCGFVCLVPTFLELSFEVKKKKDTLFCLKSFEEKKKIHYSV